MYNPEKLGIEACDLDSLQQDQSTQTGVVSIDRIVKAASGNPPKPPLPRDIINSEKGSLTIFEFCQILQDPECPEKVTIIKETVSEESKPHSSDSSQDSTANRYKYCREVIKPYLKHSLECNSEEELLKNALDSVSEDFPDYQPCYEVFEGEKDISEKKSISRRSSYSKVDASTSYLSGMEDNKEKKCVPKSKSTENESGPKCPTKTDECKVPPERESSPKPKCTKKKSAEGKPKKKCSPKPSSSCCCVKEPAIGVMCENPTFYLTERCKDTDSVPDVFESEEPDTEGHQNTITVIKGAMEDFVGKVYQTTKEAVTLITTESAKQIEKIRKTESTNAAGPTKCVANKNSETFTSFNFFRKDNAETEERSSGTKPELPKISDVIDNIKSKVESSLSMLSDRLSYDNIPENLKPKTFNDSSSPHDNPSPPREISNILIPLPSASPVPASNSVFTTIKDKIVSMFYDDENPQELSRTFSRSSSKNEDNEKENDDQLIDEVIE